MRLETESIITNDFDGFNGDKIFEMINGTKWKQAEYKYIYHYAYRPKAKIWDDRGRYLLEVDGINEKVEVRRVL